MAYPRNGAVRPDPARPLPLSAFRTASAARHTAGQNRVGAGRRVQDTLANHDLGQQGGRRGAVADQIVCLDRGRLNQLGTQIFGDIFDLDRPGDSDAVICDQRSATGRFNQDIPTFGPERSPDGVRAS